MNPLTVSLLHSLWQGAVLWLALTVGLRLLPARAANARYALATGALALTVLAWLLTWAWLGQSPTVTVPAAPPVSTSAEVFSATLSTPAPIPQFDKLSNLTSPANFPLPLPWDKIFTAGWLLGVAGGFWRMASSLSAARRLVAGAAPVAAAAWVAEFERLRATLTARTEILLRSSAQILSPCVAGLWRPVVLVPAGMLTGTPPELLRAILAHELAHIRRRDWLVNLFQLGAEALLFFNPFVWLVSRGIRREREACCDVIASGVCADRAAYSDALVWCARQTPALTVSQSLTMTADKRWLRDRVTRVLFPAQIPKGRVNWPLAAGIALTVAAAFAVLTVSVRFTVKKFTDRERVNAVLQAARELGDPLPFDFYTYDEDKKITISGSLVTPDDADGELAGGLLLNSRMFNANYSLFSQFEERAFSKAVPRGKITVSVWAENYAPVRTEPISPMPTQREISGLTVSLRKGFTGSVRFVDEQGRAVAGVQCGIKFAPTEGGELAYQQELVSDANGLVTVSNVDDSAAYIIESGRAGYQDRKLHRQQFSPDQPLTLTLAAARTVSGQINDEHGQPLPGVTVNYIGSDHSRSFPGKSLIVSDARGHVTLDTLSDEINGLQLTADGHVPCELFIIPSQREFTATLVRGFTVSGTVANLQTLPAGVRSIVRLPLYYTFQAASSRRTQTFQLDNKTDHAAFSLNNIPAGVLELKLGNYTTTVDVSGDVKNFVWDLSTTLPLTVTERKITLRVTPGNSNIAPKGILGLKVAQGDEHSNLWQFHYLTLVNGIADFTAPAPCKLTISVGELAGFYFDEQTFTVSDTDDAPVELVIHAKPAGAIYGQTFDVDGRLYVPERKFVLRKDADRDRFTEKKPLFDTREASSRGGNFLDASLPLNATYRVLLQDQCHFTLSAPLTVTAAAPVRRVELRRQRGVDVRGQVIPAADSQMPPNLYFEYRLDGGPAGAGRVIPIAADGGFVLPDLNLDLPGEYRLKCEGVTVSVTRDTSRPLTIDLLKKSARR